MLKWFKYFFVLVAFVLFVLLLGVVTFKNSVNCTDPVCGLGEKTLYLIGKYFDKNFLYIDPFPKKIQVRYSQNKEGRFIVYSVYAKITSYTYDRSKGNLTMGLDVGDGWNLSTTVDTSKIYTAARYTDINQTVGLESLIKRGTYVLVSWTSRADGKVKVVKDREELSKLVDSSKASGIVIVKSFSR